MRKYDAPHTDTLDAFNAVIVEIGLDQVLNIEIIVDDKLKPEIYKVAKCSPSEKYKTGDDINIYLNEEIFDQLPDNLQKLAIVEALAGISYDYDKETPVISKPDFFAYSGVINKYSYEEVVVLKESIRTLYQAGKEQEDASKAVTK
jgi:hypothetical protein